MTERVRGECFNVLDQVSGAFLAALDGVHMLAVPREATLGSKSDDERGSVSDHTSQYRVSYLQPLHCITFLAVATDPAPATPSTQHGTSASACRASGAVALLLSPLLCASELVSAPLAEGDTSHTLHVPSLAAEHTYISNGMH
jgi:hypothetical protein